MKETKHHIASIENGEFILKKKRSHSYTYYNVYVMNNNLLYIISSLDEKLNWLLILIIKLINNTVTYNKFCKILNKKNTFNSGRIYRWTTVRGFNDNTKTLITNRQIILQGTNLEDIEKFLMMRELRK